MKFVCDKGILSEAVNSVSPAVAQKSSLMALECVLLRLQNDTLTVIGYNLELGITKEIPVRGFEEGQVIVNARLFGEIINRMPQGELQFTIDEKLLMVIKGGDAQFTILGMNAEEYPEIPSLTEESSLSLSVPLLRDMISQTLFAVSQDTATPVLTGVLFETKEQNLYLVSVDGRRLALRKEPVEVSEDIRFIVPGKTLSELLKLTSRFNDEEEMIWIRAGKRHIAFECAGYRMISRLLEGDFIDYDNAIPKSYTVSVKVNVREMVESINRASILISDKVKNPIRTVFEDNTAHLSCETSMGKVSDSILVELTGGPLQVGYNNRYMTDALKATGRDQVILQMSSPVSPIRIVPLEGDDFIFLVMPMRLKDDD